MFLFNKSKKTNEPTIENTTTAKPASAAFRQPVDADDFFKDMGRKPKPKKIEFDIDVPEVTGLREAPLPAPGSTINNINTDSEAAEQLEDKTIYAHPEELGNINTLDTSSFNAEDILPDKTLEPSRFVPFEVPVEETKPTDPLDPDSFFKDIDRRRALKRIKTSVEVPEITGLRDAPAESPESHINDLDTSALNTDGLADKTTSNDDFIHGNISALSSESIDTGVLRDPVTL